MTDYDLLRDVRRILHQAQKEAAAKNRWDTAYHRLDEAASSVRSMIDAYTKGRTQ